MQNESESVSFLRRLGWALRPAESVNLIYLVGFSALGLIFGGIFSIVVVKATDATASTIIWVSLTGAAVGFTAGLVFVGFTERSIGAMMGLGRKVDQKRLAFEELFDKAADAQRGFRYDDAVAAYKAILDQDLAPRPEVVWFRTAIIEHELRRDFARAAAAYHRALAILDGRPETEMEFSREAALHRECTERLASLAPRMKEAAEGVPERRAEVTALIDQERFDEARAHVNRLVEDEPQDAENNFLQGYVMARMGARQVAIECYRRAVELDPQHTRALFNLAAALDQLEETDEALATYERYIRTAQNDPDEGEWIEHARLQVDRLQQEVASRVLTDPMRGRV